MSFFPDKCDHSFNYGAKCRDDEFDLDLEDIMVMEAIWLSIQVLLGFIKGCFLIAGLRSFPASKSFFHVIVC